MAMNIKNLEVERLTLELTRLTGESKTAAILGAVEERVARLKRERSLGRRQRRTREFLARDVWPLFEGKKTITKEEREKILGYGADGI